MLSNNLKLGVAVLATLLLTSIFKPLAFLEALPASSQSQQETCRFFTETQRAVCGKFLRYWNQHGGLPQFGYPISNEFLEAYDPREPEHMVQYFERAVFERHVQSKAPNDVLLSRLGSFQFQARYSYGNPMGSYPLYPNVLRVSSERAEGSDVNIKFTTNDGPSAVMAFYKNALPPLGWSLDREGSDEAFYFYRPVDARAKDNAYLPQYAGYVLQVQVTGVTGGKTSAEVGVSIQFIP